jgi:hypothetical protein
MHSWKELESLQIEIDSKLQSKFLKKESGNRLREMIAPCKEFAMKCAPILKKYS